MKGSPKGIVGINYSQKSGSHPNQANAKTGTRTSAPASVRPGSRAPVGVKRQKI